MKELQKTTDESKIPDPDFFRLKHAVSLDIDTPVAWNERKIIVVQKDQDSREFKVVEVTHFLTEDEKCRLKRNTVFRLWTRLRKTSLRNDAEKLIPEHSPAGEKDNVLQK